MAGDDWYGWDEVSAKVFPKRAPIGALSHVPLGESVYWVEVLVVDADHRMQSASRFPGGPAGDGWQAFEQVGSAKFQTLTDFAVLEEDNDTKHVLALGDDGLVRWSYRTSGGWEPWAPIQGVTFAQGTPVSAVWSHPPPGPGSGLPGFYVDCFAVGPDGRVQTASLHALDWSPWTAVGQKAFPLRTPVAAVSATPKAIDLFAVAADGKIWWTHKPDADAMWQPWAEVPSGTVSFAARTPVTAVSRKPGQIDLIMVSAGAWMQYLVRTSAGFGALHVLHPASPFVPSTRVAATFSGTGSVLQVLAVPEEKGEVKVNRRGEPLPSWTGWGDVPAKSAPHVFSGGAPATTVVPTLRPNVEPQPPPRTVPAMIVFAVDNTGRVNTLLQPVTFL